MKKSGLKMGFSAWSGLIGLSALLVAGCFLLAGGLLLGCVEVSKQPATLQRIDSVVSVLHVDSAAIYRCDTCAFARAYIRQSSGKVKDCKDCAWVSLGKPKHDKGDVPEVTNEPVNPLAEQDAAQHGTTSVVMPDADTAQGSGQPPNPGQYKTSGEAVATRRVKPVAAPSGGDGL